MSDGKIHIPARRKQPVDDQMVVKVTPEAYNALVEIYNESTLSLKQIAISCTNPCVPFVIDTMFDLNSVRKKIPAKK